MTWILFAGNEDGIWVVNSERGKQKENREGRMAPTWGIPANTDAGKVLRTRIHAMGILFNEA